MNLIDRIAVFLDRGYDLEDVETSLLIRHGRQEIARIPAGVFTEKGLARVAYVIMDVHYRIGSDERFELDRIVNGGVE